MNTLENKIVNIVYESLELKIEEQHIDDDVSLKDLGVTSMETVSLIFEFEEAFDIHIETEEMFALRSVKDVAKFINEKLNKKDSVI